MMSETHNRSNESVVNQAHHMMNGVIRTPNDSPSRRGRSVSLTSSCARSIAPSRQSAGLCDIFISNTSSTGLMLPSSASTEVNGNINFLNTQNCNLQLPTGATSDGQMVFQIPSRGTCMFGGDIDLDEDGLGCSEPDPKPQYSACYNSKTHNLPHVQPMQGIPLYTNSTREAVGTTETLTSTQHSFAFETVRKNTQDVVAHTLYSGLPVPPQFSMEENSNPHTQPELIISDPERLETHLRELECAPRKSFGAPTSEGCHSDRLYYLDTNEYDENEEEQAKHFHEARVRTRFNDSIDKEEEEGVEDIKYFPATVPRRPGSKHAAGHRVSFGDVLTTTTWVDRHDHEADTSRDADDADDSPSYRYSTCSGNRLPRGSEELTGSFAHLVLQRSPHAIYKKLELEFNDAAMGGCAEEDDTEPEKYHSMHKMATSPSHHSHITGGCEVQRSSASTTSSVNTVTSSVTSSGGKRPFPSNSSLSSCTAFPIYRDPSISHHGSPIVNMDDEEEFQRDTGKSGTARSSNHPLSGPYAIMNPSATPFLGDSGVTISGSSWVTRQQQKMLLQRRRGTNDLPSTKSFSPSPTPGSRCAASIRQNTKSSWEVCRKPSSQVAPTTSGLTLLRERKRCLRDDDCHEESGCLYRSGTNFVSPSPCLTSSLAQQPPLRVVEDPNRLSSLSILSSTGAICGNGPDSIKTTRAAGGVAWVAFPFQGSVEPRQKKRRAEGVEKGKRALS